MIRRLIILLLIVGTFAQNNYPYFSDISKQMEFEKKRIYINKVEQQEQYISGGGSEFNWLSLLNPYLDSYSQQPLYLQSDMQTNYKYLSTFEITRNNIIINEIDLLYIVGLNKDAEEIIENYNDKINTYKFWQTQKQENKRNESVRSNQMGDVIGSSIMIFGGSSILLAFTGVLQIEEAIIMGALVGIISFAIFDSNVEYNTSSEANIPKEYQTLPIMKQTLSEQQLESLAESYNRNIYEEINK